MARPQPSAGVSKQLCEELLGRIDKLPLNCGEAAQQSGFFAGLISRLTPGENDFGLDHLVDAAEDIELSLRMTVTRPSLLPRPDAGRIARPALVTSHFTGRPFQ